MSRGKDEQSMVALLKTFDKLESWLINSKSGFFSFRIPKGTPSKSPHDISQDTYSMVDLYGFPHVSRILYLKDTPLDYIFQEMIPSHPAVHRWVKLMINQPELNDGKAIIPERAFKLWVDELVTMPAGTKPPLRLPVKL